MRWKACLLAVALALGLGAAVHHADAAAKKFKIFLSMSYIGNDWQAEAANMVKAMAASKDYRDRVDLKCRSPALTRSARSSRSTR